MSDNGSQYSAAVAIYSKNLQTSIVLLVQPVAPNIPNSEANRAAEHGVCTVKDLNKSDDPYLAILAYRSTPLQNEYTAQLNF